MDPDAALERLRSALIAKDAQEAAEAFDALDLWLAKGGFLPDRWKSSGYRSAAVVLQDFRDSLPSLHHEKPGIIRSIEVLRHE